MADTTSTPAIQLAEPDGPANLKGTVPESWLCVDCGFNTAPGCMNRIEMERAFAIEAAIGIADPGANQRIGDDSEVYMVRKSVWERAGNVDGCLCIGCLEKRIGRQLKPKDFPEHEFNAMPGTERLLSRRER